jgi:hypothetical protein
LVPSMLLLRETARVRGRGTRALWQEAYLTREDVSMLLG